MLLVVQAVVRPVYTEYILVPSWSIITNHNHQPWSKNLDHQSTINYNTILVGHHCLYLDYSWVKCTFIFGSPGSWYGDGTWQIDGVPCDELAGERSGRVMISAADGFIKFSIYWFNMFSLVDEANVGYNGMKTAQWWNNYASLSGAYLVYPADLKGHDTGSWL